MGAFGAQIFKKSGQMTCKATRSARGCSQKAMNRRDFIRKWLARGAKLPLLSGRRCCNVSPLRKWTCLPGQVVARDPAPHRTHV